MKLERFSDANADLKPGMLLCNTFAGEMCLILKFLKDDDNEGFNLYELLSKNELSLVWINQNGSRSYWFKVVQKENT